MNNAPLKSYVSCSALLSARLPSNMVDFNAWAQDTLAKFAKEASETMIRQQEKIEQLQEDLRDALAAYRKEVKDTHDARSQDKAAG